MSYPPEVQPDDVQTTDISRFSRLGRNRTTRIVEEFKKQAGVTTILVEHLPMFLQVTELSVTGKMFLRNAVARAITENGGEHRDRHATWATHYIWFKREYEKNSKVQLTPVWNALLTHLQIEQYITPDRFESLATQVATDYCSGKEIEELEQNAATESELFKQTPAYASALLEVQTPPSVPLNGSTQEAPTTQKSPTNSIRNKGGSRAMSFLNMLDHENTTSIFTLRTFNGLLARPSRGLLSKETYLLSRADQDQIMAFCRNDDEDELGIDEFSQAVETFRVLLARAIKEGQVPLVGGLDNLHFVDQVEGFSSPKLSEDQKLIVEAAASFDDVTARVLMNMGPEAELFLIHLAPWHLVHQMIVPAFTERGSVSDLWVLKNINEFVQTVSRQLTESGLNFETMKRVNRTVTSYSRGRGELTAPSSTDLGVRSEEKTLPSEVPVEESAAYTESPGAVQDLSVMSVAQARAIFVTETVGTTSDSSVVASPSADHGDPLEDQRTHDTEADFFLSEHHPADLVLAETPTSAEAPLSLQSPVATPEVQELGAVETAEDHPTAPTPVELPVAVPGWGIYDTSTAGETHPVSDDQGLLTPRPSTWLHDHVPALAKTNTPEVEHPPTELKVEPVGPEGFGFESSAELFPEMSHDAGENTPIAEPASAHSAHDVTLSSVPHSLEATPDSGEGTPIMEPVLADPVHDVAVLSTSLFQETTQDSGVNTPIVEPVSTDSAHDAALCSPHVADHSAADTEVSHVPTHAEAESVLVQPGEPVASESEAPMSEVAAPAHENSVGTAEVKPAAQVTTPSTNSVDDSEMLELTPLTVTEINTLVQNLYAGTREILNKLDPSSLEDATVRRESYGRLHELYREYMLLESEVNLAHLTQPQTDAYNRLGVRFRENLAELKS